LAVHLGLAAFLVYGIRWQTVVSEAVEVELVRASPLPSTTVELPPEPRPEPRAVPEQKPAPVVVKPDIALKGKPKPEIKPETTKREDQRLQKLLMNESERFARQQDSDRLERELSRVKAGRAAVAWADKIRAKIRGNIVRPGNVAGNPEAIYEIQLLPDGSVVGDPRLKKSTGNALLDQAIERAILKSSPLPKPDDPSAFQRLLELKFRPMDEADSL
jgi:colicin import membrane protein